MSTRVRQGPLLLSLPPSCAKHCAASSPPVGFCIEPSLLTGQPLERPPLARGLVGHEWTAPGGVRPALISTIGIADRPVAYPHEL